MIYLDNAASTRPFDDVVELMATVMRQEFANPSSAHPGGAAARRRIAEARGRLLAAIGDPDGGRGDVVWTSGGTESDALAVLGAARARPGGVVVSALEHDAVLHTAGALAAAGRPVAIVPATRRGQIDLDALDAALAPDTALVCVMLVHNELGTIQPVAEVVRRVRARAPGAHVHGDAVQALGKLPVDVAALGCDSLAFAGHKLHGPKGVGALWLRHGARVEPLWHGGGQQAGLRAGTQDTPSVAGLGLAAALATADLAAARARWRELAAVIRAGAARGGVDHAVVPDLPDDERAPHVLALAFRGVPAGALRNLLTSRGVAVSTGSACAERGSKPSRALGAIGLPPDWGMIRVSFGHDTAASDVARAAEILAESLRDLAGGSS